MTISGSANLANTYGIQDYNDLNALQAMKHRSAGEDAARLKAVAQQFESMFVSMMIKSMRDANKVFGEGNMLNSQQGEFYQQMYDSQLAVTLASGQGIGLAEVIERQLSKGQGVARPGMQDLQLQPTSPAFDMSQYFERPFPARYAPEAVTETVTRVNEALPARLPAGEPAPEPIEIDFSTPERFIASLTPLARQVEAETGIDARVMLAQSALETGWGQHQIMKANGEPSFNLFGIKAHRDWQGAEAHITTTEYRDGVALKEQAAFRAYDSYADGFRDYANFLQGHPRYQDALQVHDQPKAFARALQGAGYATDPNYAAKISSIMDRYLVASDAGNAAPASEVR